MTILSELLCSNSILPRICHYGYSFLKTDYCNFILQCAKEIGVSEEEIIAEPIQYYDTKKYGENYYYEITSERPKELLWKREEFKEQSEIRIIVNSKNESAMSILRSEVIEIGELTDIAQLANANFDNGLHVAMTIKICEME